MTEKIFYGFDRDILPEVLSALIDYDERADTSPAFGQVVSQLAARARAHDREHGKYLTWEEYRDGRAVEESIDPDLSEVS